MDKFTKLLLKRGMMIREKVCVIRTGADLKGGVGVDGLRRGRGGIDAPF